MLLCNAHASILTQINSVTVGATDGQRNRSASTHVCLTRPRLPAPALQVDPLIPDLITVVVLRLEQPSSQRQGFQPLRPYPPHPIDRSGLGRQHHHHHPGRYFYLRYGYKGFLGQTLLGTGFRNLQPICPGNLLRRRESSGSSQGC